MKEQENIKECPRIHCSAQCEDNLALMENLDQRPGLHNCTFPNKRCAIWRAGQTSGLLRPVSVRRHRQPHSFHLVLYLNVSLKDYSKGFHSKSVPDFSLDVEIPSEARANKPSTFFARWLKATEWWLSTRWVIAQHDKPHIQRLIRCTLLVL